MKNILVSEILPVEVPIIFSNLFFAEAYKNEPHEKVSDIFENQFATIPYKYYIRKNADKFRSLSLIHPYSQLLWIEFYRKFADSICEYCKRSQCSLRYPFRESRTDILYHKLLEELEDDSIFELENEKVDTFFSYKPFTMLYKFYESEKFLNCEKQFKCLHKADISSCFESIYTHTIAWAVKGKEASKTTTKDSSSFSGKFDQVMRNMNYNETNGIPIGPEISRIFAEIILQKIDQNVINELKNSDKELRYGVDYKFYRYVDDYFIFTNNQQDEKVIIDVLKIKLKEYNLHLNESKSLSFERPFLSNRSKLFLEFKDYMCEFESSIFAYLKGQGPDSKFKVKDKYLEFSNKIKILCVGNGTSYFDVTNFCHTKMLVVAKDLFKLCKDENAWEELDIHRLQNVLMLLTKIVCFMYSVAPTVTSSYNFCQILFLIRNINKKLVSNDELIDQLIYDNIVNFFSNYKSSKYNENIELLNVLCFARDLGDEFLLPPQFLFSIFKIHEAHYFTLMTLLYYCRDLTIYQDVVCKIFDRAKKYYRKL